MRRQTIDNKYNFGGADDLTTEAPSSTHDNSLLRDPITRSALTGVNAPDLPPRIDRASKPNSVTPPSTLLTTASARNSMGLGTSTGSSNNGTYGRSAHERLFASGTSSLTKTLADSNPTYEDEYSTRITSATDKRNGTNGSSLDRKQGTPLNDKNLRTPSASTTPAKTNGSSYDSVSSYDSCNAAMQSLRLGPNAPDDLKSVPSAA